MNESTLTRQILLGLNAIEGVMAIKYHGSMYGLSGTPDIFGVCRGVGFLIEVKVGKNQPTKLQAVTLCRWARAGARVGIAHSVNEAISIATGEDNEIAVNVAKS